MNYKSGLRDNYSGGEKVTSSIPRYGPTPAEIRSGATRLVGIRGSGALGRGCA